MMSRGIAAALVVLVVLIPLAGCESTDDLDVVELMKLLEEFVGDREFTLTPGTDLAKLNTDYSGYRSKQPADSENKSDSRCTIWIKYNGYNVMLDDNGTMYRAASSTPLIEYGNSKGKKKPKPTISFDGNKMTVEYKVKYSYIVESCKTVCTGEGESETCDLVCTYTLKYKTLTITKTYIVLPIHPSCNVEDESLTLYKTGTLTVIGTNTSPFDYNYELYLSRAALGDTPYIKAINVAFEILTGDPAYYAAPIRLDPPIFEGYGIHVSGGLDDVPNCSNGALVAKTNVGFINMTYYDAFGYPHKIEQAKIRTLPQNDNRLAMVLALLVFGMFILKLKSLIPRR